jgi:hypothetical protein
VTLGEGAKGSQAVEAGICREAVLRVPHKKASQPEVSKLVTTINIAQVIFMKKLHSYSFEIHMYLLAKIYLLTTGTNNVPHNSWRIMTKMCTPALAVQVIYSPGKNNNSQHWE